MNINIKYFLDSSKPKNAERALRHHLKLNQCDYTVGAVETYLDKGCVCICSFEITSRQTLSWQELVFEVIRECQNFGYDWCISNQIEEELNLTTSSFHAGSGITMADVYVSLQ